MPTGLKVLVQDISQGFRDIFPPHFVRRKIPSKNTIKEVKKMQVQALRRFVPGFGYGLTQKVGGVFGDEEITEDNIDKLKQVAGVGKQRFETAKMALEWFNTYGDNFIDSGNDVLTGPYAVFYNEDRYVIRFKNNRQYKLSFRPQEGILVVFGHEGVRSWDVDFDERQMKGRSAICNNDDIQKIDRSYTRFIARCDIIKDHYENNIKEAK